MNKGRRTSRQKRAAVSPAAEDESVVRTEDSGAKTNSDVAKKAGKTRVRWVWNLRLALATAGVLLCVTVPSAISYRYHSQQTVATILLRAEAAAAEQNFADQIRWLARYTLLHPDDLDAVVQMALAADAAADVAKPEELAEAVSSARGQLATCIGQLGSDHSSEVTELRGRLIKRLLQLGGDWHHEAERQVILLAAARDDSEAARWLALAVYGQLRAGLYRDRSADTFSEEDDYWNWLASQKVGDVLVRAVEQEREDLELFAAFLDAYVTYPNRFEHSEDEANKTEQVKRHVERVLTNLRSNSDSRSKLMLYQFHVSKGNDSQAAELLREAAETASKQLADPELAKNAEQVSASDFPPYYWDYLVVVEGTRRFVNEDPDLVERWYDQLMSARPPRVPRAIVERVYLDAGIFSLTAGDQKKAIETWESGLDNVNPNSLELLESVVSVAAQTASGDEFIDSLNRFSDGVEIASLELSGAAGANTSPAARAARGRQIERSRWKLGVLESIVAVRDGRQIDGINLLNTALSSTADVSNQNRISAARQLASLYGSQGSWDKAAEAIERAIDLAPDDEQLHLLASDAWRRSGNLLQALKHWRAAGNSASLADQIAGVESAFNYQLQLIPEERDFSEARASIKRIAERLSAMAPAASEEIAPLARRLDILQISLPPSGVLVEEYRKSPRVADAIAGLAEQHVDEQDVQAFAAERLAEMGRNEESQAALERLSSIVGESASSLAIVKARLESANGDPLSAAQHLIEQATLDVENESRLLNLAASFAALGNSPELAYEAIEKIPADRQSLPTLFRLSMFSKTLPADSAILSRDGAKMTPQELSMQWEDRLRQVEGERGTYWRCSRAIRVIEQLRSEPNRIENDDPRLLEGNRLVREILAVRPSWGTAISLQGWISAIAGKRKRAVDQLRAGIAAGDRRLETRRLLWGQLSLLDRWQEADEEIRRAALTRSVDRYGALRIDLALRQGDFERSLQLAEAGIEQQPDDFLGYVVLCNTARLAAQGSQDPEERSQLLQRAWSAIGRANKLATKPEPAIYSARLQLALAAGDEAEISIEVSRVEESRLSEYTKLRLTGMVRLAQRDYGAALEALERASQINPSNAALIELAEVYRRLRRPSDEISALRIAHDARPNDADLANRLARAIVSRDGKDVDWNELSQLLSTGGGVTSGNRLLYATLLAAGGALNKTQTQDSQFRGTEQQQNEAITILRELREDRNSWSDDAARILALLLQDRLRALSESQVAQREQGVGEVQSIYESLLLSRSPQVADSYRYAVFLLEFGEDDDAKIAELQKRLQSSSGGVVAALELGLRIATRSDNLEGALEFVQTWAETAISGDMMTEDRVASIAGASLLRLGLTDKGLEWFDRAYRKNPETLKDYAGALVNHGKTRESVEVCASHFENHGDALSATLLVESLVALGQPTTSSRHQAMINSALAKFDKNAPLVEGVATLLMKQQAYAKAVPLYQQTLRINPRRIRALNNLAMTLSEMPGRQSEGIEPIERAVKLVGEVPELLDTKGVVLLRAGRLDEAEATFEKALKESDDPRFRFHLIVTLLAQDREADARRQWDALNLVDLTPAGLMPDELETLKQLKQKYGAANAAL